MTDEREHNSSSGSPLWIWAAALFPLLYFLSVGPVVSLCQKKSNQYDPALRVVYYPLILLHDHTFMQKPIEAYCDLWGVK